MIINLMPSRIGVDALTGQRDAGDRIAVHAEGLCGRIEASQNLAAVSRSRGFRDEIEHRIGRRLPV